MYALCRHIKTDGKRCGCPAIKDTPFCHNHREQRQRAAQIPPPPDPYGWDKRPLPLVPPEDRPSVELNLHIVIEAFNNGHISATRANAFNRLYRTCEVNLTNGEREHDRQQRLAQKKAEDRNKKGWYEDADQPNPHADTLREVVLTPEGEQIAPLQEVWEQDERHRPNSTCPCHECAIEFRNAQPEQHHQDCKCTTCAKSSEKGKGESVKSEDQSGKDEIENVTGENTDSEDADGGETFNNEPAISQPASEHGIDQDPSAEPLSPLPLPLSPATEVPDRYEAHKDPTLFEGMKHKPPSIEYTYELRDRIQKRHNEHNAKIKERNLAQQQANSKTNAQPPAA